MYNAHDYHFGNYQITKRMIKQIIRFMTIMCIIAIMAIMTYYCVLGWLESVQVNIEWYTRLTTRNLSCM